MNKNTPPGKAEVMAIIFIIMILSENFSLVEFLASETADKLGIDNSLSVVDDAYIVSNLEMLCRFTLEPIRKFLGRPVRVSSGYRCKRLNMEVGGSPTSDHCNGLAADIYFDDFANKWYEVVMLLITSAIPFDQLIVYKNFLHIGVGAAMRRQVIDYRNK